MDLFQRSQTMKRLLALVLSCAALTARAAPTSAQQSEGLRESLLTVQLPDGATQQGLLSLKAGTDNPEVLAVLLPGSPSIVRPVVADGVMVESRLNGNFLVRARRQLVDERIATLIVDCRSDISDECHERYQSSQQRYSDVMALIAAARKESPSLKSVWLVGTSMGTISSAWMAKYGQAQFAGAIHTATITDSGPLYSLSGFDYGAIRIPQVFIHHHDDPCRSTRWSSVKRLSEKYGVPLLTVHGGSGFSGPACQARTQHGFAGMERSVMRAIAAVMESGEMKGGDLRE